MSNYIIKVENTSGVSGTIISDRSFSYTDNLNSLNKGQIRITGTGETKRGLFEVGSKVYFYRDGTLEFIGLVNNISYLDAGGISADLSGYEVWLGKENGEYASSPYTSTASATIATSIIGESNYFSAGVINTGEDIDLKLESSSSLYNALSSLIKSTSQDIGIDYVNLEVDVLDHKGSSTSIATLNDSIQVTDLTVRKSYPIANDVRVFGKGDGNNQIKSALTSGQDATSKVSYGIIQKDYLDSSVITIEQANNLADKLVAKWKEPVSVYEFNVVNPSLDVVCGDVLILNAKAKGLNNEEVRVVALERGIRGSAEFLTLQVTNKEYSEKERSIENYLAELQKNANNQQTYMQGTTNVLTFSGMINAKSNAPLNLTFNVPDDFIRDEAGNLRVESFTLDYDLDPFRDHVGTASESDVAPDVLNASGNTEPDVNGTSADEDASVSGVSADEDADVTGSSDEWDSRRNVDSDSNFTESVTTSWETVCTVNPDASALGHDLVVAFSVFEDSGGPEDISVRIVADGGHVFEISQADLTGGAGVKLDGVFIGTFSSTADDIELDVICRTGTVVLDCSMVLLDIGHSHADGTYNAVDHDHADGTYNADNHGHADGTYSAANHGHDDGTYGAESHNHSVGVDGDVTDEGSVNSSEVDIYLDHWNGSSWVNKHSILNTGKIIDTDLDISDSGTYPDAGGYWRVRIYPDSASADLVHAVIKLKHQLDT